MYKKLYKNHQNEPVRARFSSFKEFYILGLRIISSP